jgi:hypothetical protein
LRSADPGVVFEIDGSMTWSAWVVRPLESGFHRDIVEIGGRDDQRSDRKGRPPQCIWSRQHGPGRLVSRPSMVAVPARRRLQCSSEPGSTGHMAMTTRHELVVAGHTASVEIALEQLPSASAPRRCVSSSRWRTRLPDGLYLRRQPSVAEVYVDVIRGSGGSFGQLDRRPRTDGARTDESAGACPSP